MSRYLTIVIRWNNDSTSQGKAGMGKAPPVNSCTALGVVESLTTLLKPIEDIACHQRDVLQPHLFLLKAYFMWQPTVPTLSLSEKNRL